MPVSQKPRKQRNTNKAAAEKAPRKVGYGETLRAHFAAQRVKGQ